MLKNIVPTTMVGIKRLAKDIKAERDISLHEAQDVAAQQAGFQNFRHARNVLGGEREASAKLAHRLFLTVYWTDRDTRESGRETLAIALSCLWSDLISAAQLKNHRTLYAFRPVAPDHLERGLVVSSQSEARRLICSAARGLQFMEATKLRPSKGHSRAFPGGTSMNAIPGHDHSSIWYDPASKGYVYIDEPYDNKVQRYAAARAAWAQEHGFDLVKTRWPGMYAPDLGSRMYLNSNLAKGVPLDTIVSALDRLPSPIVEADWCGESGPRFPMFISPGTVAQVAQIKVNVTTQRKAGGSRNTVGYVRTFVGPQRRPVKRMPLEAHACVGQLLKSVVAVTYHRPGAHNRIDAVRSELDEWVQREYRSEAEMPQEQFVKLYYGESSQRTVRGMPEVERAKHCDSLGLVRKVLAENYPDCAPLRGLLKKLDMAQKSLEAWR